MKCPRIRPWTLALAVPLVTMILTSSGTGQAAGAEPAKVEEVATLKRGDVAPPLRVARWIKGAPGPNLEKGKFYVVECWATWCGPCLEAIPHLTKLAHKYKGRVTFIGVSVSETFKGEAEYDRAVDRFVARMGDKMDYFVARDTLDGAVNKAWPKAGGAQGIPVSFLVDGDGRIVLMTHPMELERILDRIVDRHEDPGTVAAEVEAEAAKDRNPAAEAFLKNYETAFGALTPYVAELRAAEKAKDWIGLGTLCDKAEKEVPASLPALFTFRAKSLAVSDPEKAEALLEANKFREPNALFLLIQTLDEMAPNPRWARKIIELCDFLSKEGDYAPYFVSARFKALWKADRPAAENAWKVAEGRRQNVLVFQYAAGLCHVEDLELPWRQKVMKALKASRKATDLFVSDLALAYSNLGMFKEAAATQKALIRKYRKEGSSEASLASELETLRRYQKGGK